MNGASSSGKTSILQALQDSLEEPYLNAGIDPFIWMLPERYLERPLWDEVLGLAIEAGEPGRRLFSGMHHAIAGLARAGNHVLADHVLVVRAWLEECARLIMERMAAGPPTALPGYHSTLTGIKNPDLNRSRCADQGGIAARRITPGWWSYPAYRAPDRGTQTARRRYSYTSGALPPG